MGGSTAARHRIVSTSAEYLERLGTDARKDRGLALEIGSAWLEVARVQGLPSGPNLGDLAAARASLSKAESFLDSVLESGPATRAALLRSAEIAHEQMIVGSTLQQKEQVVEQARKTVERQEALAKLGAPSASEIAILSRLLSNVAMAHYNMQLYTEAVAYGRRTVEFAAVEPARRYRVSALSVMASSLRNQGDLEGAVQAITESKRAAESIRFPTQAARIAVIYPVVLREGMLLGQHDNINLGRREEALHSIRAAFEMVEAEAARGAKDVRSRTLAGSSGVELVGLLAETDPAAALAIADRCILRLREAAQNLNARRGEAMVLAASSYPLRRLQRPADAGQRIGLGLKLLREVGDYPAKTKINPEGELEVVMRALADHDAASGMPAEAVRVYRDLLNGLIAWPLAPEIDMLHANALTRVWRGLAAALRRAGRGNEAAEYENRRRDLWQRWDRQRPDNVFVKRQLAAIP